MTNRERILRAFRGLPTNRVVTAPFIYYNYVAEYFNTEKLDYIEKGIQVYRELGFDIVFRMGNASGYFDEKNNDSPNWHVTGTRLPGDERSCEEDCDEIIEIATPERTLRQVRTYRRVSPFEVVSATGECFIKDMEDLEQFQKYQPPLKMGDLSFLKRAKELIGDDGIVCPWATGAFNTLALYRRLDDLLMDPYLNPELYEAMIAYFIPRFNRAFRHLKEAGADAVVCDGNQATGTSVGPGYFEEHVLPMEQVRCRAAQEAGLLYLYHNCGDAKSLLPLYHKIGMNVYESLTPPPYGDTIFSEALEKVPKSIVLCGGVDQINFLRTSSPAQIREKVRELMNEGKKRGNYMMATSDYFNENTPIENVCAFSQAAKEFGKYEEESVGY